jgi:DNA-binding LacI/PurR family transcriptional regulator
MPVTLLELGKRLHLDKSTISLALRDSPRIAKKTRDRVQAEARALGYAPNFAARALSAGEPRLLATVLSHGFASLSHPVVVRTMQHLAALAADREMLVNVLSEAQVTGQGRMPKPDGAFVWGDVPADVARLLETRSIPCVVLDAHAPSYAKYRGPTVRVDNHGGAAEVARHLFSRGARRALFVRVHGDHLGHREREHGFAAAWPDERTLRSLDLADVTDDALRAHASRGGAAIFCSNDHGALQIWVRLARLGIRIPQKVRLAGFDGEDWTSTVGLTTVMFDFEAIAQAAFESVMARIDGRKSAAPAPLAAKLRVGTTT